jgi:hypothetical protein
MTSRAGHVRSIWKWSDRIKKQKSNRGEEQAASKIEKAELLNHADYTWKIWKYPTYSTRQGPLSWKIIYIIDFFDMWLVYRFSIRPMHVSRQPICGRLWVKSKLKLSSHLIIWRNMNTQVSVFVSYQSPGSISLNLKSNLLSPLEAIDWWKFLERSQLHSLFIVGISGTTAPSSQAGTAGSRSHYPGIFRWRPKPQCTTNRTWRPETPCYTHTAHSIDHWIGITVVPGSDAWNAENR